MRVLFYLPVITDRHFEGIVLPLIRRMYAAAEVHVAGPPQWEMTGLTERQLMHCTDMPDIQWHILDGEDHPSLRTAPADPEALVRYVADIAPDLTLCRSADTATPMRFPGIVRFLMEPIIPPFRFAPGVHGGTILDGPRLYDQGFVPDLSEGEKARLDALFMPRWQAMRRSFAAGEGARAAYLEQAGLPVDKTVVALPLNVEAAANFFIRQHSRTPSNAALIAQLAPHIPDDTVLALTQHPLNIRSSNPLDRSVEPIEPVIERLGGKVRLVTYAGETGNPTAGLVQHCDGAIICDSKAFGFAAFFGKPVLRISHYESAPWLHAQTDLAAFLEDVRAGAARGASEEDARSYFAFHYANDVFAAHDPALTAQDIVARMEQRFVPQYWEQGIARLAD